MTLLLKFQNQNEAVVQEEAAHPEMKEAVRQGAIEPVKEETIKEALEAIVIEDKAEEVTVSRVEVKNPIQTIGKVNLAVIEIDEALNVLQVTQEPDLKIIGLLLKIAEEAGKKEIKDNFIFFDILILRGLFKSPFLF